MGFNLGKPILVMIICAVGAGVTSRVTQRSDARADLELWAFSEQNYKVLTGAGRPAEMVSLKEIAEREMGVSVDVKLIQYRAMQTRLASLFMSDARGPDLPDVVDLEISSVGRYFRPPVKEVGLLPLNDLLEKNGWTGKILESRFAPWSKGGLIFGIPQDVHPVMIGYDEQAFREAGVDLASSQTWEEFIENGLKFQEYWNKPGQKPRWTLEMSESNAGTLVTMLLQRGINLVDQDENVHLTNPRTIDTLVRYVRMLVGPRKIGGGTGLGNEAFSQDLRAGYVSAFLIPDWRMKYLKDNAPTEYAGRMRLMPMPAWPDSPYRTSTAGGSMVAIPRNAPDPEASFRLIEIVYLSPEALQMRSGANYVLPSVKAAWQNPDYDKPDPYFGGQPVRRMIADLAAVVPPRYVSPASTVAEAELSMVLIEALDYAKSIDDVNDDRLVRRCTQLLEEAATRLKRQVEHGRFDG